MPACRVEFHPDAVVEAQAAKAWYENRNTIAADAFVAELDRAVAQTHDCRPVPTHLTCVFAHLSIETSVKNSCSGENTDRF